MGVLGRSQGVLGDRPKEIENTEGSLGVSGGGAWGALEVIFVVWGGPSQVVHMLIFRSFFVMSLQVKRFPCVSVNCVM